MEEKITKTTTETTDPKPLEVSVTPAGEPTKTTVEETVTESPGVRRDTTVRTE